MNKSSLRPTMLVDFLAACCVMPFFVAGGSKCSLGNDCVSEFISELPSTAESLLEQAKRLRCEYTKIVNKRRNRLRKKIYQNDRARGLHNQAKYDEANKETINTRKRGSYQKSKKQSTRKNNSRQSLTINYTASQKT
jgi:hypothetical protein